MSRVRPVFQTKAPEEYIEKGLKGVLMKEIYDQLRAKGFEINPQMDTDGVMRVGLNKDGEGALALEEELRDVVSGTLTLHDIASRRQAEHLKQNPKPPAEA